MGAWGTGLLQDDTPLDLLGNIINAKSLQPAEDVLLRADLSRLLEYYEYGAAVAAALVCVLNASKGSVDHIPALGRFAKGAVDKQDRKDRKALEKVKPPSPELAAVLRDALSILDDPEKSEVAGLWREDIEEDDFDESYDDPADRKPAVVESPDYDAWAGEVRQLRDAFNAAFP